MDITQLGMVVVFLGIVLVIIGSLSGKGDTKFAVGGFVGPIPFGFGNDARMVQFVVIVAVAALALFLFFR